MGAWAGFGLVRALPSPIVLPANRAEWRNYRISFDFHERSRLPVVLEIQIKNRTGAGIPALGIRKTYTPSPNGWDTISASLDELVRLPHFSYFDPSRLDDIVCLVNMGQSSTQHVASIDNIRFDGPEQIINFNSPIGTFLTTNDYVPDSDYDGSNDKAEFLAGTDPLNSESVLRISRLEWVIPNQRILLEFQAVPNLEYQILASQGDLSHFLPIRTGLSVTGPGDIVSVTLDVNSAAGSTYFQIGLVR